MKTQRKSTFSRLSVVGTLLMATVLAFGMIAFAPQGAEAFAVKIIAKDTFNRGNQQFWGKASDGQRWGADANIARAFSIKDKRGVIGGGSGLTYNAVLGPNGNNMEAWATGTISSFKGSNFGVMVRATNGFNYYKAFINGDKLVIEKRVNGVFTRLASVNFSAPANTTYTVQLRANNQELLARVWKAGDAVPGWMAKAKDGALKGGQAGIRVDLPGSTTVRFSFFQAIVF